MEKISGFFYLFEERGLLSPFPAAMIPDSQAKSPRMPKAPIWAKIYLTQRCLKAK